MTDTQYELSKKGLLVVILPIAAVIGLSYIVPERHSFTIVIGYILLTGLLWAYLFYRARSDEEAREAIESFFDTGFGQARLESMERIPVGGILILLSATQAVVAYSALPESEYEALATLVSVSFVEFGVFRIIGAMILGWMLSPVLWYFLERGFHGIRREVMGR